jgi:short-chain fatty acids transporter
MENFISTVAFRLNQWTERWIPGAFTIACLLTVVVFLIGVFVADATLAQCIQYWGGGFWSLLEFSMQMVLIVMTGYIVAVTPSVQSLLERAAAIPRNPRQVICLMAFTSMVLAWVNWGLSIVGSAVFVRFLARRHRNVDYRVLVAVAYLGLGCTWHGGLSASAPLLVATAGHFMEKEMGTIPTSATIFSPFNLILTALVIIAMTFVAGLLHPRDPKHVRQISRERLDQLQVFTPPRKNPGNWVERMEWGRSINVLIGGLGLVWFLGFRPAGEFSINTVNFLFLMLGVLLHPSPQSLMKAGEDAGRFVYGIVLQFPFYAGMYGIIRGTGLSEMMASALVRFANASTLPVIIYWYSGIVDYFVP